MPLTPGALVFEENAQDYDRWFETDRGQALFALELHCLKSVKRDLAGRWLEVGVGSGRFAQALQVGDGVDPAPSMARLASARGVDVTVGVGEHLPYANASFDGVLMVCTICFVQDVAKVLSECARVLAPGGHLLIGFVPLDSVWGQYHSSRGKAGHTYYAGATFFLENDLVQLAKQAGLSVKEAAGCELPTPKPSPGDLTLDMRPTPGVPSFRAVLFYKA